MNMVFSLTPAPTPAPAPAPTPTPTTTATQPRISSRFSMYDLKKVTKGCRSCGS